MKTYNNHNPVRVNLLTLVILVIMLGLSIQGTAQSESRNKLLQMIDEDRTTIDAIAGYDQDIQHHILEVAQTPEALNKIEELQKKSKDEFRNIIEKYDRDAQSAFYEIARYPNLITDLVSNGLPSTSELNRIVSNYPVDIQATAKDYALRYFDVLVRIDQLNNEIDRSFQEYLEPYNSQTRESVKVLLAYPEIVSVLIDDMNFTTQLGEVYSQDPEWTGRYLGKVSQELAVQSKQDLDAYKNQIQNDPEAYNEMLDAADRFAKENNEVRYLDNSSDPVVEVRVINSYPFWFGYPYWYSAPYWRPRPVYYHTGFYRNSYGSITFVGLPSFQFMHWQTYYHPSLFPHLSYNYYSYYENHYVNRYRDAHRPVPYHGFYRSIEHNVINNPRVNNSSLQRIDRQRGHDIVRQPNRMGSGSARRGEISNSQRRSDNGGTVNRREYNTVNPGRSEGPFNQRGSGTGRGTIRRESSTVTNSPEGTTTVRPRQGNSVNRGSNENSQYNNTINSRTREYATPTTTRQRTSSSNERNGAQQRSAYPQQRKENAAPAGGTGRVSSGRGASRVERSSVKVQPSGRSERREARAAGRQSAGSREGR
jgi:hypothetical protein